MKRIKKEIAARQGMELFIGGAGYGAIEVICRGYTHISMVLLGAVCFRMLVRLSKSGRGLIQLCLAGGAAITLLELLTGCVVNLWLGLGVWDYSHEAWNLWGQICPRFFLIWCGLGGAVIALCRKTRSAGRMPVKMHKGAAACFSPSEKNS